MVGLAATWQEGHIPGGDPPFNPPSVSFSLPPYFSNFSWFHDSFLVRLFFLGPAFTPFLFIHLPQSTYSQTTLYLSPFFLSHTPPLNHSHHSHVKRGEEGVGGGLLCLTDRSGVQTSPCGRPYQRQTWVAGCFFRRTFRLWSSPELWMCVSMWHVYDSASLIRRLSTQRNVIEICCLI